MFAFMVKKIKSWQFHYKDSQNQKNPKSFNMPPKMLSANLNRNVQKIRKILGPSIDIVFREFNFGYERKIRGVLVYIQELTDKNIINNSIIKPLMVNSKLMYSDTQLMIDHIKTINSSMVSIGDVTKTNKLNSIVNKCLAGYTILLVDGCKEALIIDTIGWATRNIEEPQTETTIRGPREGFTENLFLNLSLMRRKIKNPNLTLELMMLGKQTQTNICIAYLKNIVNPKIIKEVKNRLNKINIDAVLESGYIEQLIEDNPFSIFSTIANSEKPDVVASKLLEGRVAILVDGTPFVLTVPMLFVESFQSAEDHYSRPYYASLIRLLRFVSFLLCIFLPAIYVAFTTFHQELIPTPLLLTMMASKEGTPFPALYEAFGMIIIYEILREAAIRLPRPVGQSISIVGALVIGQTAVSAGLIGAAMVIVVSFTAICSFIVTAQADATSLLRLFFILLAGILGWFGVAIGILYILIHLCSLRSFGIPYLSPLSPLSTKDLKDTFIRVPMKYMTTRPKIMNRKNLHRQKHAIKKISNTLTTSKKGDLQ